MYDRIDLTTNPGRDQIVASVVQDFDDVFTGDVPDEFTVPAILRRLKPHGYPVALARERPETVKEGERPTPGTEPSAWPEGHFDPPPVLVDEEGEPDDEPVEDDADPDDDDEEGDEDDDDWSDQEDAEGDDED